MKFARRIAAVFALGASAALAPTVSAGISSATITSDPATSKRHMASFSGTASFDSDSHQLTITLSNMASRGYLTGFAFNTESGANAIYQDGDNAATRHVDEDAFDALGRGQHRGKRNPFGKKYMEGASIDGKWNNSRHFRKGVAPSASHTWVFDVTGTSDTSVIGLLTGNSSPLFIANFNRFKGGKSDQIGATFAAIVPAVTSNITPVIPKDDGPTDNGGTTGPTGPTNGGGGGPIAAPLPPGAWTGLATMGLMALVGLRRRIGFGAQ